MKGYCGKFSKNFSAVTAPLIELLKKSEKYHWSEAVKKHLSERKKCSLSRACSNYF